MSSDYEKEYKPDYQDGLARGYRMGWRDANCRYNRDDETDGDQTDYESESEEEDVEEEEGEDKDKDQDQDQDEQQVERQDGDRRYNQYNNYNYFYKCRFENSWSDPEDSDAEEQRSTS